MIFPSCFTQRYEVDWSSQFFSANNHQPIRALTELVCKRENSVSKAMQPAAGPPGLLPAASGTPEQQWGVAVCARGHEAAVKGGSCSRPVAERCCSLLFLVSMRCLTQPGMRGTAVPGKGRASQHLAVTTSGTLQRFHFLKITTCQALIPLKQALNSCLTLESLIYLVLQFYIILHRAIKRCYHHDFFYLLS